MFDITTKEGPDADEKVLRLDNGFRFNNTCARRWLRKAECTHSTGDSSGDCCRHFCHIGYPHANDHSGDNHHRHAVYGYAYEYLR